MADALKQFAVLVSNFIQCSLMPIIRCKPQENYAIIQQWEQLRSLIVDVKAIQMKQVQNFFKEKCIIKANDCIKQLNPEAFKKHSLIIEKVGEKIYKKEHEDTIWRYPNDRQKRGEYQKRKGVLNSERIDEHEEPVCRQSRVNVNSFELLLASFRKLGNTFENNHNRLIRKHEPITN